MSRFVKSENDEVLGAREGHRSYTHFESAKLVSVQKSSMNRLRSCGCDCGCNVAKHSQQLEHVEVVLCARKTCVSYWYIVSS